MRVVGLFFFGILGVFSFSALMEMLVGPDAMWEKGLGFLISVPTILLLISAFCVWLCAKD